MSGFKVQMLTTPGVRKDQQDDQELGEDATGFLVKDDYVVLWVADGAPGTKVGFKGYNFGSRVLAKYMGEAFETVALKSYTPGNPFDDAFLDEFETELRKQLSTRLSNIHTQLSQLKDQVDLDDALEVKFDGNQKSYGLTWTATFVGALVDMKNNVCYTMSIGDCIALSDGTVTLRYEPPPPIPEPQPAPVVVPVVAPVEEPHVLDLTKKPAPINTAITVDTLSIPPVDRVETTKWLFPPIRPKAVKPIKHTAKEQALRAMFSVLDTTNNASNSVVDETVKLSKNSSQMMKKNYDSMSKKIAVYSVGVFKKMDKALEWLGDASVNAINITIKFIDTSIKACDKFLNKVIDDLIDLGVQIVYYKKIKAQKEAARLLEEAKKLKEAEEAKRLAAIKAAEEEAKKVAEAEAKAAAIAAMPSTMIEEVFGEPKLKIITGRANRMFVLWSTNEALDTFEVTDTVNSPCFGEIEDVKSIILMSDGVIPYNEIECKFGYKDPDNVWDELRSTNNATDDDKTAIYFKILGQN